MKSTQKTIALFTFKRATFALLSGGLALTLTGCWTPPNAQVQPPGEPRLIQGGVSVEDNAVKALVQSVDASARSLQLKLADGQEILCPVNPAVKDINQVQAGDQVKVTLAEKLAVYVLKDGRVPGAGGTEETIPFSARVQLVDPSYRLLTLQYLDGRTVVLKAGLDAKLSEMHPGDAVVLASAEVMALHIEKN